MKFGNLDPAKKSYTSLTLQNSWGGAVFYNKVSGLVIIHGNINHTSAAQGSVIATLPSGFRPPNNFFYPVTANITGGGLVNITTAGELQYYSGNLASLIFNITFVAA